jgi:hypothetical protein
MRLWRELRDRGYAGGYTAMKRTVREIRPEPVKPFEVRFETPPGEKAQVDLARFEVVSTDEPSDDEARPDQPAEAEHHGEQPNNARDGDVAAQNRLQVLVDPWKRSAGRRARFSTTA